MESNTEVIKFNDSSVVRQATMPNGFAILYYPYWNDSLPDNHSTFYEIYFGDKAKGNKLITKEQALSIIETHNLELVVDSIDGKIWE